MSAVAWRRLLLALSALVAIQTLYCAFMVVSVLGESGIDTLATNPIYVILGSSAGTPFLNRVRVYPGPARDGGLRSGDAVDFRELAPVDRWLIYTQSLRDGKRISLTVLRKNGASRVSLVGRHPQIPWVVLIYYAGELWMLGFAALIAWRRAESAEARTLALLLILWNLGQNCLPDNGWSTPWPALDAFVAALGAVFAPAAWSLLATFSMLFVAPRVLLRRTLAWLSYASSAVAGLYGIAAVIGIWTATLDPANPWYTGHFGQTITGVLPIVFPLLCLLVTVAQTRGLDRARIFWASGSLALFFAMYVVLYGLVAVGSGNPPFADFFLYAQNLFIFIAPLGFTYSFLNRRLLDIGFAINRALVFSTVSVIIIGIFVLVEWGLTEWFSTASHTTNILVSGGLALTLGLSVRAIHYRVDLTLDAIFFRKRHEDEQAIRTFAHEAAFITAIPTLFARTVATLERHADASFVRFFMYDGAGKYGSVDENDPAIVALRAGRKLVDLHSSETALEGDFAYPMVARGRLVGALCVGPKRSGDPYAPDESDAISELARAAGDTFDVLSGRDEGSRDSILDALRAITARLDRMSP